MSYQNAIDALHMKMPARIPRTEYSTEFHWPLLSAVGGRAVDGRSAAAEREEAVRVFEKAFDFGLHWNVDVFGDVFGAKRANMGHAVYQAGGVDYDDKVSCYFADEAAVLALDPWAEFGAIDHAKALHHFNARNAEARRRHPDQVCTGGVYITMMSGLIELFGWDLLLLAIGTNKAAAGQMADRYASWILQYFEVLAESDCDVFMVHDDIVWTSGAFLEAKWYRDFIFRNYEKLFDPLKRTGKKLLYTSDGNYTAFIDDIAACGVNGFVMEPVTDMAYIARHYGQTHAFIGNADCTVLQYGDKDAIRREVARCVDLGRECPGFFMATGNHIPPNIPVDNILWYQEAFAALAERR